MVSSGGAAPWQRRWLWPSELLHRHLLKGLRLELGVQFRPSPLAMGVTPFVLVYMNGRHALYTFTRTILGTCRSHLYGHWPHPLQEVCFGPKGYSVPCFEAELVVGTLCDVASSYEALHRPGGPNAFFLHCSLLCLR